MKNKKVLIISIITVILLLLSVVTYYVISKEDKATALSILDKQWIEKNKNKMIDFGIVNDIPVFNYNGKGLIFEFVNSLEETTDLEFNKVPYKVNDDVKNVYSFKIVDKASDSDILVYTDNYVLATKNKTKYNELSQIKNLKIGVLEKDLESINTYLSGSTNLTFKTFDNIEDLINEIKSEVEDGINAVALPKTLYLKDFISNNLTIAYNITEITKDYVITLGGTERLNSIFKKYYTKWSNDNYEKFFNENLSNVYFDFKGIDEKEIVKFRSKRYLYGFYDNKPYDALINEKLYGINSNILKQFSKTANIEINYKDYHNYSDLITDFNENKLDFMFDNNTKNTYPMDVYNTISYLNEKTLIISHISNNININSLNSLNNHELIAIKNQQASIFLNSKNIKNKQYNNMNELLKNINKQSIIVIDYNTYRYYMNNEFKNYKIDYEFVLDNDYKFIVREIKDNQIFSEFFNFYLGFINENKIINDSFIELKTVDVKTWKSNIIYYLIGLLLIGGTSIYVLILKNKKTKKVKPLSKGNKLKYIDQLTSLKNRNYLNDNLDIWDNSEIYPQTIIIVDLNNIAYINDNYGHIEGDKVITEAANILIRNQIENSDIIRTNGNEFLIYLVGYDEKQVLSYMRKISKDLKEISHGFGAALGYSIINDAIKTIDDAVNEATTAMRENKEGFNS